MQVVLFPRSRTTTLVAGAAMAPHQTVHLTTEPGGSNEPHTYVRGLESRCLEHGLEVFSRTVKRKI